MTAAVEVWWAAPADHVALVPLLDDDERDRHRGYRLAADRDRFLTGAALARLVLAGRLGADAASLAIDRRCPDCERPHGRPMLRDSPLVHSVAHSGDSVVVALGSGAMLGVDVERVDTDADPPAVRSDGLEPWPAWVATEAVLKATGEGFRRDLADVYVSERVGLLGTKRFVIVPLPAPVGHVAALAWRGRDTIAPPEVVHRDGEESLRAAARSISVG